MQQIRIYAKKSPLVLLPALALSALLVIAISSSIFSFIILYKSLPDLGKREMIHLQYGFGKPPFAEVKLKDHYLVSDQGYDVTLELSTPANSRNIKIGNFMVELKLITKDEISLFNISRPASLTYLPPIALHLSPFTSKIQHLSIPLIESTVLQTRGKVPVKALIELGRRDAHLDGKGWDGGDGEVQVYKAWLRFDGHLTGVRWFLYYHPILSFFIFTPTFLFSELLAALTIWGIVLYRKPAPQNNSSPISGSGDGSNSTFSDETDEGTIKLEESDGLRRRRRGERIGMTDVTGSNTESYSETEAEQEEEEEEGSGSGGSWQGIERPLIPEIKVEDDDDRVTLAGSESTRATDETFGPSLASSNSSVASGLD